MPSVSVTTPEMLAVGAIVLAVTLLLSRAARHHLALGRRRLSLALRSSIVIMLVLALSGFQLVAPVDRLTSVFVIDLSDSVGEEGRDSALAFVREALEERPAGDRAAIVAFGGDALVERLPAELEELERFASIPTRASTDVGAALRLAAALFPDDSQKRIVLVSDGNDTTGRGQSEAALAASRGIQIETFVVGLGAAHEVVLQRLHSPATARVGEDIEVELTITSTLRQPATVRLYGDGAQIGVRGVTLEPGTTRVAFTIAATEAGFHTFRALVEAGQDTFAENNRGDSHTVVKGEPRILLVAGSADAAGNIRAALSAQGQDVTELAPEQVPTDLTGLAGFDAVVLADVAATRLGGDRMAALQVYTRDLGRGLVMIGGPSSYGAGGYENTPLEEVLPVDMDVRDRERQPDVALVVVIDKSGSMDACHCNTANRDNGGVQIGGVPKVDIGKEAILRAVSALTQRDEFGVVAFNENAHWVIRTAPLANAGDVAGTIAGIAPDGNTNIFAGLSEAVASLERAAAERRHIVLLTDGWSSTGAYNELLERMSAANITLSAVGAGGGGADAFLGDLARRGGGRYYSAVDPTTIPDIFLKETQQVSGQQIVEEPFFPILTSSSPILRGLEDGLPRLLGYNGTTSKATAQTVLVSTRDDPVLAQWQYGLGRAAAWTSDATGRWAQNWVGWNGFNRFFSQLVSWTFPGEESGGLEAEFVTEGDRTVLRLRSAETDGTPRNFYDTIAGVTDPGFTSREVRLDQTAPGVYEAELGTLAAGAYALRVVQTKPGETPLGRTVVLVAPTPAEYRLLGTNERLLSALRGATGGRALESGEEAWRHDLGTTTAAVDLWPLLLLLSLLLWPLDVAVRRVSVARSDVSLAREWMAVRWRGWRGAARRPEPVAEMLAAKGRAGGRQTRSALLRSEKGQSTASPVDVPGQEPAATETAERLPDEPAPAAPTAPSTAAAPDVDSMARLREAKRRARRRS
jgi:uncharacterized membrane protein